MISLENSTKEKYSNKISATNTKYQQIKIVQQIREKVLNIYVLDLVKFYISRNLF